MPGHNRVTFASFGTVSGNGTTTFTPVTVGEGQRFALEKVEVESVADPAGAVDVTARVGAERVAPRDGTATMANDDIVLEGAAQLGPDESVDVQVDKTTTGSIDVSVLVTGRLEEP